MEELYRFWTAAAGNGPLEWVAVLTGFACVWLAARESLWNFPVAIVSCGLFVVVYTKATLYSDVFLQVVFIVLAAVGWYQWLYRGRNAAELPVTHTPVREWAGCAAFVAAYTLAVGYYLLHHTDATLPHWDAFTTAGSLAGQFLLIRKRLENWFVWIVVDIIFVPILWYKHLYAVSALYALYLALAVYGYVEWRRALRKNAARSLPLPA
ncbi:nicotinamide riboside transporter PnuC [Hymenobacter actinosclerus]|uniref:Nicotinamide riboside transporter PnuC n=1 Tax=Hymenobacter actinosclerus TaxID=82805 RepID=A0A1I0H9B9_9BACT|nr:nicotinamide riboside transporter PnuC [Hymenobacter actinosclerus]SET79438.1 nicotinamide mononucleotide transporter [Hymenobacter actinosclerus]